VATVWSLRGRVVVIFTPPKRNTRFCSAVGLSAVSASLSPAAVCGVRCARRRGDLMPKRARNVDISSPSKLAHVTLTGQPRRRRAPPRHRQAPAAGEAHHTVAFLAQHSLSDCDLYQTLRIAISNMANLPDEINALKEKIAMLEQRRDLPTVEKDERVAITNEIVAYVNEITSIRQQITQQGNPSVVHVRSSGQIHSPNLSFVDLILLQTLHHLNPISHLDAIRHSPIRA